MANKQAGVVDDPRLALERRPRYLCGPPQNVMASEWMLGNQCTDETPEGFEDFSFTFFSPIVSCLVGSRVFGVEIQNPFAGDVIIKRVRGLSDFSGVTGGDPLPVFGLRLPSGYSITGGDLVPSLPLFWWPVLPSTKLKYAQRMILDLADYNNSAASGVITTVLEFDAVRRRPVSHKNKLYCTYPDAQYKPQFAYKTPKGYRDEPFFVPFRFAIPADGRVYYQNPWRLDDDAAYVIRGIIFPAIGTAQAGAQTIPPTSFPALVRMWDTFGNPTTQGLVLAMGLAGQSGLNSASGTNAFGFIFEPEVQCAPGGSVTFDFQVQTNAVPASFSYEVDATDGILFASSVYGVGGNATTIALVDPGANGVLGVAVAGSAVTVTLATDAGDVITSTLADVAAAVNGTPAALALLGAILFGDGSLLAIAQAATDLAGGAAAAGNTVLQGTLLGVKRFSDC